MDKFVFVDRRLQQLASDVSEQQRVAIDLGVCNCFAGGFIATTPVHLFVSAFPFARSLDRTNAYNYVFGFKLMNPLCAEAGLLTLQQIKKLNAMGARQDFSIQDTWTASSCNDGHGRVDGYYSLTKGRYFVDCGKRISDAFLYFAFIPNKETPVIF